MDDISCIILHTSGLPPPERDSSVPRPLARAASCNDEANELYWKASGAADSRVGGASHGTSHGAGARVPIQKEYIASGKYSLDGQAWARWAGAAVPGMLRCRPAGSTLPCVFMTPRWVL